MYLDIAWELKKYGTWKCRDTNCNWCARFSHKKTGTITGRLGNKRLSGNHPNYSSVQIGQNTKKSPGDLRTHAVTRTPVENHRPRWYEKLTNEKNNNNALWINYIKAKIYNAQENIKFRFCADKDETINCIISESSKLFQKEYKTRNVWRGKGIHWDLCKKLKFDLFQRIKYSKFSWISRYKQIIRFRLGDQTIQWLIKDEK